MVVTALNKAAAIAQRAEPMDLAATAWVPRAAHLVPVSAAKVVPLVAASAEEILTAVAAALERGAILQDLLHPQVAPAVACAARTSLLVQRFQHIPCVLGYLHLWKDVRDLSV